MLAGVSESHRDFLVKQGIPADLHERLGLRTIEAEADLPEAFATYSTNFLTPGLPGILFPWTDPDGEEFWQLRLDHPDQVIIDGDPSKYLFPRGQSVQLGEIRRNDDATCVLIVEGTKQSIVAGIYAPDFAAVYGITGCRGWMHEGVPTPHLSLVEGKDVVIVLDADAASNLDVFAAGMSLRDNLLDAEGALSVRFLRVPGGKKSGLDDILGSKPELKRAETFARLIEATREGAKKFEKPADTRPLKAKQKGPAPSPLPVDPNRGLVVVNGDRWKVTQDLTEAMVTRWDRTRLFNFGGAITRRTGPTLKPVTLGMWDRLIAETALTAVRRVENGNEVLVPEWPDQRTARAILSEPEEFSPLEAVSQVPFVRPDGSICTTPGYDAETSVFLELDPSLDGITIPEYPTSEQVRAAVQLLTEDLLVDFPFPADADRTNAVATLLTPFFRHLVDLSPLAVFNGKDAGSGKGLLSDLISITVTGKPTKPLPYTADNDAELRKVITSAFRMGARLFIFDEVHHIRGEALASALTALDYADRILGESVIAHFKNSITWIAMGNNIRIDGDLPRRAYEIRLAYPGANPESRHPSSFKHLDIRDWARIHRADLVCACLTLIRAWYAADCPRAEIHDSMGSFEKWQKIAAGVVAHAGLPDFLEGSAEWRKQSNFTRNQWLAHLRWLSSVFGEKGFGTRQVQAAMRMDENHQAPLGLTDFTRDDFTQRLGMHYFHHTGQIADGLSLEKVGKGHGGVGTYVVKTHSAPPPADPDPGQGPDHPDDPPPADPGPEPDSVYPEDWMPEQRPEPTEDPADEEELVGVSAEKGPGGVPPVPPQSRSQLPLGAPAEHTPSVNPIMPLLHLVDEPGLLRCGLHDVSREVFGAAGILRGCPKCHPETFLNRPLPVPAVVPAVDPLSYPPARAQNPYFEVTLGRKPVVVSAPPAGEFHQATFAVTFPTGRLYGLDVEGTYMDDLAQRSPDFRVRLVQVATRECAWVLDLDDPSQRQAATDLLSDPTTTFVSHSPMDVLSVHAALGVDITNRNVDTLVLAAMAFTDRKAGRDLKTLTEELIGPELGHAEAALHNVFHRMWEETGGRKNARRADVDAHGWATVPVTCPEYLVYAGLDAIACRQLAELLIPRTGAPARLLEVETWLAGQANRIQIHGFCVDTAMLDTLAGEANAACSAAEADFVRVTGLEKIRTPKKIAWFGEHGVNWEEWEIHGGLTTVKGAPSLAKDSMGTLGSFPLDEPGQAAFDALQRFQDHADRVLKTDGMRKYLVNGRIHPTLKTIGASATARMSSTDPNIQNFSKKDPRTRGILVPEPGHVLISADFDQVELRVVAALAGETKMIEAILRGDDLHQLTADAIGKPRPIGKMTNFLIVYGGGGKALSEQAGIPLADAQETVRRFWTAYPRIAGWAGEMREQTTIVRTLSGRRLEVGKTPDGQPRTYANPNYAVQSGARDLLVDAWYRLVHQYGYRDTVWYPVHDELILQVPEADADRACKDVEACMSFDLFGVPITASATVLRDEEGVSRWGK